MYWKPGSNATSFPVSNMSADNDSAELGPSALSDLTGKIALVTGGGTGMYVWARSLTGSNTYIFLVSGLMIARGFARNGAKVYISGRRLEALKQASEQQFDGPGKLLP